VLQVERESASQLNAQALEGRRARQKHLTLTATRICRPMAFASPNLRRAELGSPPWAACRTISNPLWNHYLIFATCTPVEKLAVRRSANLQMQLSLGVFHPKVIRNFQLTFCARLNVIGHNPCPHSIRFLIPIAIVADTKFFFFKSLDHNIFGVSLCRLAIILAQHRIKALPRCQKMGESSVGACGRV